MFESVKGVKEVYSGYAGGFTKNPNYNQIGSGKTGHAESVEVIYDPAVVNFGTLVQVFFGSHDPTTPNRQGPDRGTQYRSIAFYTSDQEREIILNYIELLQEKKIFSGEIVTEIKPWKNSFMPKNIIRITKKTIRTTPMSSKFPSHDSKDSSSCIPSF